MQFLFLRNFYCRNMRILLYFYKSVVMTVGPARAADLVCAVNAYECMLIHLVDSVYNIRILTHREGDAEKLLLFPRISALDVDYRTCSVDFVNYDIVKLEILICYDIGSKCLRATKEYSVYNSRTDEGGDYTEKRDYEITYCKHTENDYRRIDSKYNDRAFPRLEHFANDERNYVNTAGRAAAKKRQRASRTDAKTAEQRSDEERKIIEAYIKIV